MRAIIILVLCVAAHVNSTPLPKIETPEQDELRNSSQLPETDNSLNDIEATNQPNICITETCAKDSARILSFIDSGVDPCENFYEFACGKYIRNTAIPENKDRLSSFSQAQDEIDAKLETIFLEEQKFNEPNVSKLAKAFTKICMDESTLNDKGITPMVELLKTYGGWPVVEGDQWMSEDWNWLEFEKKMSKNGMPGNFILDFGFEHNLINTTKNIITINRATFGIEEELFKKGLNNKNVKAYFDFMIDVAVVLGANRSRAENELNDVFMFEQDLAMIEIKGLYTIVTIESLQVIYPIIDWLEYINSNLNDILHVDTSEEVALWDSSYISELEAIIKKTSKRTLANYLAWRLVLFGSAFINGDLHQLYEKFKATKNGVKKLNSRSNECAKQSIQFLPIAAASVYVRQHFNDESRKLAVSLAKNIHEEFVQTLQTIPWMDAESKSVAIKKANAMYFHIGYADELLNDTKLDEHYKDLDLVPDSLLHSVLNIYKFNKIRKINELHNLVNKTDWESHSTRATKVDAFYAILENSIQFPAGILQDQFFSSDRPSYMNFATIGFFIGHEITHGFDDSGRMFDSNGNRINWWQEETLKKFVSKATCFIEQYSNYTDAASNMTINGVNTQDENIADNGGIKVAYAAYQKHIQRNGIDTLLPGVNYTANQLFWISGAQLWCSVTRPEFDQMNVITNEHTPFKYRINGAFSNSQHFSNDFHCPTSSGMNPKDKCEVW